MDRKFLMGLDAGGGKGSCLLVDVDSGAIITADRSWYHAQAAEGDGWSLDLDLDAIWRALSAVAQEAMRRADASADQVTGLAVTSMRHGMVLLDRTDEPLMATPNRDARAVSEAMELAGEWGDELFRRTGRWPSPVLPAARLRWLARVDPSRLERAARSLSLSEWVTWKLCGEMATDPSHAGETMLFDLVRRDWASDLLQLLGLPANILPPVAPAGTRLGGLAKSAAVALGLRPGIPVAVCGGDTQCALLGAGAVMVGHLGVVAGTTAPVQLVLDGPVTDPQQRVWTGHHVVPGLWVLESNAGAMGQALDWIACGLYPDSPNPVARLAADAAFSPPGAAGILSTLGADVFDARQMALPIGHLSLSQMIPLADPPAGRHLGRAVLEGMACAIRANAEQALAVAGLPAPSAVFVTGGISRSALWTQMLSDLLGRPVTVAATPDGSALGAAICAGVGAGIYADLTQASAALAGPGRVHHPTDGYAQEHQDLYRVWTAMCAAHAPADSLTADRILQHLEQERSAAAPDTVGFRPRVLVTAQIDSDSLARLRELAEVEHASYRDEMRLLSGEDLVTALRGFQVLVTEVDVVDADALAQLPDLRLVISCRGNAVNIDLAACTAYGIPVVNTPGRNADAVADLTVAFMLMLARKLPEATAFLRLPGGEAGDMGRMAQAFAQFLGAELWCKTVGLVGLGAVGRAVARRLHAFGARLLVYDPLVSQDEVAQAGAERVSLPDLLARSDVISLHAPVTFETRGMIGSAELALTKPGSLLVNTARAALVDEAALVDALRSGRLAGAALDVFGSEPPAWDDPLLQAPHLIATPHIGGNTVDVAHHQGAMVVEELTRLLRRQPPRHVLNPDVLAGFSWRGERTAPATESLEQLQRRPGPAVSDFQAAPEPRLALKREPPAPAPAQQLSLREATARQTGQLGLLASLRRLFSRHATAGPEANAPAPSATGIVARFEQILRVFLASMADDPALLHFAAGKGLVMEYHLTDADLRFHMLFRDGVVEGALGAPPIPPDITLKMKADIFDGMMTGRVNGTQAAMTGKLTFTGDTSKAMAMTKIARDMGRLYESACEQVGDPGDLTALGAPTAVPPAPPAAGTPGTPTGVPRPTRGSGTGDERDEIVAVVEELYAKNLITATGGNVSVRVSGRPDTCWITPSQMFKGSLHAGMMVRIDLDGHSLDEDALAPSSEKLVHTAIYRSRPEIQAIVHSHAPWSTLLALTETPLLPVSTEAAFLGEVPLVPFIMPGTADLAQAVSTAMGRHGSVVLMQNHGPVVAAANLRRAANLSEVVERTAEMILRCKALGREPAMLPAEAVQTLREVGQMMG